MLRCSKAACKEGAAHNYAARMAFMGTVMVVEAKLEIAGACGAAVAQTLLQGQRATVPRRMLVQGVLPIPCPWGTTSVYGSHASARVYAVPKKKRIVTYRRRIQVRAERQAMPPEGQRAGRAQLTPHVSAGMPCRQKHGVARDRGWEEGPGRKVGKVGGTSRAPARPRGRSEKRLAALRGRRSMARNPLPFLLLPHPIPV